MASSLRVLRNGVIVVILKHVGITDRDKERLKITVNMPASDLASVDLIKDLTQAGLE